MKDASFAGKEGDSFAHFAGLSVPSERNCLSFFRGKQLRRVIAHRHLSFGMPGRNDIDSDVPGREEEGAFAAYKSHLQSNPQEPVSTRD